MVWRVCDIPVSARKPELFVNERFLMFFFFALYTVYMKVRILLNEPTMGLWQPQSPQALYSPGRRKYCRPL